ncbi:MAG: / family protein [Mucilaginibacter sp.]|jgi:hypothetical protein|nr:/ family protein [Mucilaginibacter sp.]
MEKRYEEVVTLINENLDNINFGEFGKGVSDFWINSAQARLNVVFPPSYVWWLKNYSGGEILGDEIYSVYEKDFDTVVGGDIVYVNELERKDNFTDNTQLVIQTNDQGEIFYFDLLQISANGEYPVYRDRGGYKHKYADDFLAFLSGRILDKY